MNEADELARDEDFDPLPLSPETLSSTPAVCPRADRNSSIPACPVAHELIDAVEVLREMNREGSRKVPQNAPLGFIRRRWGSYVFGPEGIDRRFYELCIMAELKTPCVPAMSRSLAPASFATSRTT